MNYLSLEKDRTIPYGYYHVIRICDDVSHWPVAYINNDLSDHIVEIAETIAAFYQLKLVNNLEKWSGQVIK